MKSISLALLGFAALASAKPVEKRVVTQNVGGANLDTIILQYALTLEHLENNFYTQELGKYSAVQFAEAGFPAGVYERLSEVSRDEATHVEVLSSALGANATKACSYNFNTTSPREFVTLASVIEGAGVSAYLGAAANITNGAYLGVAASILTVESRHAAWMSGAVLASDGGSPYPAAFDTPVSSFSAVYSLAAQFITSCPETNPALPVKKFPTLSISPAANFTTGTQLQLTFNDTANAGKEVFAAFINGIGAPTFVSISANNSVAVPSGLEGQTYVLVSSVNGNIGDENVIAGPAVIQAAPGSK